MRAPGAFLLAAMCGPGLSACGGLQRVLAVGRPSPASSEPVVARATVEAIDAKSRVIRLRSVDGHRMRFYVGGAVQDLGRLRKGDVVSVTYHEAVALRLRRTDDAGQGVAVAEEAERARPGELPDSAVAEVVTVTATVVDIDRGARRVTLEMPGNERLSLSVRGRKPFDRVAVGDSVEVTYREAIAVAVRRSPKP